jgi:hypothetical protein
VHLIGLLKIIEKPFVVEFIHRIGIRIV